MICGPSTPLREAASSMVEAGASSVLVDLGDRECGIMTDHDLRSRRGRDGPVPGDSGARCAEHPGPHRARRPARRRADARDARPRHSPHTGSLRHRRGARRRHDVDLLAAQARTSFVLRRAIADASNAEELGRCGSTLNPTVIALRHGGLAAGQISAIISVVVEAADPANDRGRRRARGPAPGRVRVALARQPWPAGGGSILGRRLRNGLGGRARRTPPPRAYMRGLADQVVESARGRRLADVRRPRGRPRGARRWRGEPAEWRAAIGRWLDEPDATRA